MVVRLATSEDLAGVMALMRETYRSFGELPPEPGLLRRFFERAFEEHRFEVVVAEIDGELVAMLSLAFLPTTYKAAEVAFVDDVHVREDHRRRGIGRAMLEFARAHAASRGAVEMKLAVANDDVAARHLYEAVGFQRLPAHLMALDVDGATTGGGMTGAA